MDQRPLRLGDLVDDYCPRERRITNHAIVAIVGEEIRQTRCTTCDGEHVYKGARGPRIRKKESPTSALYDEVLASAAGGHPPAPAGASEPPPDRPSVEARDEGAPDQATDGLEVTEPGAHPAADEGWAAHRPLIRATLPRSENDQPPPRPIPEFTMHQRNVRGGHAFRQGTGWYGANGHAGSHRQGRPVDGNSFGNGNGQPHGAGPGAGHPRSRHGKRRGKKRSH